MTRTVLLTGGSAGIGRGIVQALLETSHRVISLDIMEPPSLHADYHHVPVDLLDAAATQLRGPTGCRYLDDPRQAGFVQDGWNLTGDMAAIDADGYVWYGARSDDMIVSSGYNIAGPEVEQALLQHPAVHECGVVGAAHGERGQVVKAYVVLAAGHVALAELTAALQAHVRAVVAPYKCPRMVAYVAGLPKTETGKLQRFKLRSMASA